MFRKTVLVWISLILTIVVNAPVLAQGACAGAVPLRSGETYEAQDLGTRYALDAGAQQVWRVDVVASVGMTLEVLKPGTPDVWAVDPASYVQAAFDLEPDTVVSSAFLIMDAGVYCLAFSASVTNVQYRLRVVRLDEVDGQLFATDGLDAFGYRSIGNYYAQQFRDDLAIAAYRQALALAPDDFFVMGNIGVIYFDQGNYDEALQWFDRALKIVPDDVWTLDMRAAALRARGAYAEALADYTTLMRLEPLNMDWRHERGVTHLLMLNAAAAVNDFSLALAMQSAKGLLLRSVGFLLLNNETAARIDLDTLLSISWDAAGGYALAWDVVLMRRLQDNPVNVEVALQRLETHVGNLTGVEQGRQGALLALLRGDFDGYERQMRGVLLVEPRAHQQILLFTLVTALAQLFPMERAYQQAWTSLAAAGNPQTAFPTPPPAPILRGGQIRQWALLARADSDTDYSAMQATGAPDTDGCGTAMTAWASLDPQERATLYVFFERPVLPVQVNIHQSSVPGAIVRVDLIPDQGAPISVPDSASPDTACPFVFELPITLSDLPLVRGVAITVDQNITGDWNEIDAVELVGRVP